MKSSHTSGKQAVTNGKSNNPVVRRRLLNCGILAALLYVVLLIVVPTQFPSYDAASQTVSELLAIGTPTRTLWLIGSIPFSLLLVAFGEGVRRSASPKRALTTVGWLLIKYGIVCLSWPPMHQRDVLAAGGKTIADTMHIVFTAVTSLLMLLAMGSGAAGLGRQFRLYSIITILILLIFGTLTSLGAPRLEHNQPTPWISVLGRVNIYATMLWLAVLALFLLRREKQAHPVYQGKS